MQEVGHHDHVKWLNFKLAGAHASPVMSAFYMEKLQAALPVGHILKMVVRGCNDAEMTKFL